MEVIWNTQHSWKFPVNLQAVREELIETIKDRLYKMTIEINGKSEVIL